PANAAGPPAALETAPPWQHLRSLRSTWARELGMPAFAVFTNRALAILVREPPSTPGGLASIASLGRARADRPGTADLAALAAPPPTPTDGPTRQKHAAMRLRPPHRTPDESAGTENPPKATKAGPPSAIGSA